MSLLIPVVPSVPNYRFSTSIDDATYIFDFRWNTREAAWFFDISEADETSILQGVKVVLGMYLGRRSTHRFFRDGVLVAKDTTAKGVEATLDDLGIRVQLLRFTAGEIIIGRGLSVEGPLPP